MQINIVRTRGKPSQVVRTPDACTEGSGFNTQGLKLFLAIEKKISKKELL